MRELRSFYIKWLSAIALVVALAAHGAAKIALPWIQQQYPTDPWHLATILEALTSRPALVAVLALSEWLLRTRLWKWRWFHPELDFSGNWKGVSTYTAVQVGTAPVPLVVHHEARIEQDCLGIRLIPAKGSAFVRFESTAVNLLVDPIRLVYSYHVLYTDVKNFPAETFGYEEMSPVEHDGIGRPTLLHGWFAHCARGQEPVYSGTVQFKRA